jgi:hypothetical protein
VDPEKPEPYPLVVPTDTGVTVLDPPATSPGPPSVFTEAEDRVVDEDFIAPGVDEEADEGRVPAISVSLEMSTDELLYGFFRFGLAISNPTRLATAIAAKMIRIIVVGSMV